MLRVSILGCGKIADDHAGQIRRIRNCELVGVCDIEPLMARQLAERFAVKRWYTNLADMLSEARPDIVHITTPPQGHFSLAKQCLEAGSHIYVEKPFTLILEEAQILIDLAEEKNLKLTVGHDDQFSNVAHEMRRVVSSGYLGGPPIHMESTFCYDISDPAYARALLSDKQHWVRRLPGKLLHNIISHGVARIAEFLECDEPEVIAHGFVSPLFKSMGEREMMDELRVIINGEGKQTAYFTFSSQMRPMLHEFRMFGPSNGLVVDQDQETVIKLRGSRFKSYGERFFPPLLLSRQYLHNLNRNLRSFRKRNFHFKSGMKSLIESFYESVTMDTPPPIPYREILLTARIMDDIFRQVGRDAASDLDLLEQAGGVARS
jgi:predicted dehydrogenase